MTPSPLVVAKLRFDDHRRSCPRCIEGEHCVPSSVLWGTLVDALVDRNQPIPEAAEALAGADTRPDPGEGRKSPPRGLYDDSEWSVPQHTEEDA